MKETTEEVKEDTGKLQTKKTAAEAPSGIVELSEATDENNESNQPSEQEQIRPHQPPLPKSSDNETAESIGEKDQEKVGEKEENKKNESEKMDEIDGKGSE